MFKNTQTVSLYFQSIGIVLHIIIAAINSETKLKTVTIGHNIMMSYYVWSANTSETNV